MIWSLLGKAASVAGRGIYWTIGAVQAAAEGYGALRRLVRAARKGVMPHVDDTDPIPLTQRAVERIADYGRCAGHESEPRCETMRPPPKG